MLINMRKNIIGVDLFAGAGGLSLGAKMAGIDVVLAIEKDNNSANTYLKNHKDTNVIIDDISNIKHIDVEHKNNITVLFGGPPCQGFSSSNQKTRNKKNPQNWLYSEFIRLANSWNPDWIVFENVEGIVSTEKGYFLKKLLYNFNDIGYNCIWNIFNASDYGVPQLRQRFFLIASKKRLNINLNKTGKKLKKVTVFDAIGDLPDVDNGNKINYLEYDKKHVSKYSKKMRTKKGCTGHLVTKNSDIVIERYKYIPEGGNWQNIPNELMTNYKDKSKCHTNIYHRLSSGLPSITLGNFRKSMFIHPWQNRGLSIREAARLQSFPDYYDFIGTISSQQQQVGNAVPPYLSKYIFDIIIKMERLYKL